MQQRAFSSTQPTTTIIRQSTNWDQIAGKLNSIDISFWFFHKNGADAFRGGNPRLLVWLSVYLQLTNRRTEMMIAGCVNTANDLMDGIEQVWV